jgi:hypothetical protein
VAPRGVGVGGHGAQRVPRRVAGAGLHLRAHLAPLVGVEEEPRRPDELEGVPLDRVVARRDHQAARGVMVLDRELARRRRRQADVDHAAAGRLQRAQHRAVEQRARDAAVASHHHRRGPAPVVAPVRRGPRAEACGEARNHLRRQPLAHPPPHARHADHQPFVRHSVSVRVRQPSHASQRGTRKMSHRGGRCPSRSACTPSRPTPAASVGACAAALERRAFAPGSARAALLASARPPVVARLAFPAPGVTPMSDPFAVLPYAAAAGGGRVDAYEAQQLVAAGLTLLQRSAPLARRSRAAAPPSCSPPRPRSSWPWRRPRDAARCS